MPYKLSKDGLSVLQEDGKPVPGGKHGTKEEALKHLQALEVNVPEAHSERIAIETFMAQDFKKPFTAVPMGVWYRGERVLNVSEDRLQEMYKNWQMGLPRYGVNVNVEHGAEKEQPGMIGRVNHISYIPGQGIKVDGIEFSQVGQQLLDEDRYRAISPEVIWTLNEGAKYQDPKTGKWHDNVLVGLAVTTTPFFGEDVQVFSAKEQKNDKPQNGGETFDSPTRHQVHVENTLGGQMDKSKMSDAQKKQMKEMMDDGASEEEALKKLQEAEAKETKDEKASVLGNPETFTVMQGKIETLTAQLKTSQDAHEALVHQFAAERQLRRTVEFVEAAEKFSALPAKADELGMKMLALYDADSSEKKELYGYFNALLEQMNGIASQSELFTSTGSERFDNEAQEPFLAAVEKIRSEKFGTEKYEDGFSKAYNLAGSIHKDLARAYIARNTHTDR